MTEQVSTKVIITEAMELKDSGMDTRPNTCGPTISAITPPMMEAGI